ncbi:monosaccharide-transporting ATPase [Candidatus Vecturithrix granuli]|uniref:Monosaccharide-transporting ATPase n=1 Tax=Vecturithrix granuli TaxID=1499967 RepID=A0A081C3T6_VECG1|nr:monosaccharide-transporting ATPase [Candidatus Vecturithrix granuli]
MRKVLIALLVVTFLIPSLAFAQDKIVIGLTLPSLSHPFFVYLQKNVMDEAEKLGVEVIAIDAENVAAKQMSIVEDFIAKGVKGVLMSPIGEDALVPAVEALNDAGIPVATVDRKVAGGDVFVHVGADNVEGGRVAARYLIEKLGGKGNVLELEGTPGASPAIDRKAGFDEVIATSEIKILVSQTAKFERAMGQSVMENLLQVHKDFQGVFAANDEMILGSVEAMSAAGVDPAKVITIGYDAIPDALNYIKDGKLSATIEQFPGEQAKQSLRFLVEYIRDGKEPPSKEVYITPVAITSENLDQAEHKVE